MTRLLCRTTFPLLALSMCAVVAPLSGQAVVPLSGQAAASGSGQALAPGSGGEAAPGSGQETVGGSWREVVLAGGEAGAPPRGVLVHIVHGVTGHRVVASPGGSERLRFEPWGGVLFDAYRNEGGNGRPAWIGAVRFGYELGSGTASSGRGWRVIAEVARAEAAEAGTEQVADSLLVGFRTEWWLATAGVEWDLAEGWMGATLEAQGGGAWLQREIVGGDPIPPGTPGTSERAEYTPVPALVVAVSGYRHLTHRVQLRLRLADVVTDVFEAPAHSPALGLGLRFVFE